MRSPMACVFRDVVQCLFVGHVFFHLHSFCCCHNCIFDLKEACRRKVNHQHTFDLCYSYIYVIFELNIQILLHHNSVDGSCHTSDNRRLINYIIISKLSLLIETIIICSCYKCSCVICI